MKAISIFLSLISVLITVPMTIYMSFLVYQHIQATELMWILFWINWPLIFTVTLFSTIAQKMLEKDK